MQASHGGTATNDTIASHTLAALLRSGLLPQASVYPAELRATHALLRRRTPLRRTRAALVSPVPNPHRSSNLPELGQNIAANANRAGIAERVAAPAVQQHSPVDLALIPSDDHLLQARELASLQTAKPHEANPLYLVQTVPGLGTILTRVRRYDIWDMARCPRGPAVASDGRLVPWATAAAGTRLGPSGTNSGNAHLQWAFSEA
jgi:hypothetical protein